MANDSSGRASGGADEAVKPALLGILLNLIRTSSLSGKVDASEVLGYVSTHWRSLYHAGVFDVGPLYRELLSHGRVTSDDAAQVFLLLKKREAKLGVTVKLPDEVTRLPEETQQNLLREGLRAGVQSGVTLVGIPRMRDPAEANEPAPAPRHRAEGLTDRVRSILNNPPKK